MSNKSDNFKDQFKQALISTVKVISDDYKISYKKNDNETSEKKYNFFNVSDLSNKYDFIKLRAETDSEAKKKNFQVHLYLIKIYPKINLVNHFIILQKKLVMKFWAEKCSKE